MSDSTQVLLDKLAVGTAARAAEMALRGWDVLCVADDLPERPAVGTHLPLRDGCGNDPNLIALAVHHVIRTWDEGKKVFVCCKQGRSRSALVAAAALVVSGRRRWFSDSLHAVRHARPSVSPRDDTLAEVLAVVLKLRPAGPNHE